MMDAIILVGGQGTRLQSVVSDRPKPLAEVNGIPFLDFLLRQIEPFTSQVILAAGYRADQIALQYSDRCLISREEKALGTGGAIANALKYVQGDRFWVLNGDSYFDISFKEMEKSKGDAVIACRFMEDSSRYGQVKMDGAKIVNFKEKTSHGDPGWINGGIYILKKSLFDNFSNVDAFSLENDFFPTLLLSNKEIIAYCSNGKFIDIGTPTSYAEASEVMI